MTEINAKALDAASRTFRRMHNSVCYPSASEGEANWAATEILSAYLAALDATPSNSPLEDTRLLRERVRELSAALEPFAKIDCVTGDGNAFDDWPADRVVFSIGSERVVTVGDLRRARSVRAQGDE